jgi:hypothetical protein
MAHKNFGQRFAEVQVLVTAERVSLVRSIEGRESMQGRSKERKISKGKKIKINTVMKPEADSRLRLGIF